MSESTRALVALCSAAMPLGLAAGLSPAYATDLGTQQAPIAAVSSSPLFSAEVFSGYLAGIAGEYVDRVPGDGSKLSQLNWQIDNAAVLGGRLSYQALDWLLLRAGGWSVIASDNAMDDFDWLRGYNGFDNWSHWSSHSDTRLAKAFQIDIGGAARFYEQNGLALDALAGYRFLTTKMNVYGGNYIYSKDGFRDKVGTFDPHELGVAYQQWWHTPYVGLGATYTAGSWRVTGEVITSPFVVVKAKDHHNLRDLLFTEDFAPDWMVGVDLGAEYAVSERLSLTAKAEYQKYFEAAGETLAYKGGEGLGARAPKPAAGADLNMLMLTVGLKANL
ncbi:omptin family outer membrane protease [Microvirga zambiensis]|uniref:omptin family outer membrane protease n=1 Tax=Microvirga zambiensis TaxID=1402137 RepID=UPI00191D6550